MPLLAAGGIGLLLIVVVAAVGIRWLTSEDNPSWLISEDDRTATPPGSGDDSTNPPTPPGTADGIGASITFDGDLGSVWPNDLLPDGHMLSDRAVISEQDLLVMSHPGDDMGAYRTVSLLRAEGTTLTVIDRQQLRCSYDEVTTAHLPGAFLEPGDGVGWVTCGGWIESDIMGNDPDFQTGPTRVWALVPDGAGLRLHPGSGEGWYTIGFHRSTHDAAEELLATVCTDRNCSPEQYAYAVHLARDPATGSYQAVACSEPGGPRIDIPGGPWEATNNPALTPPTPERGCGPERYVTPEPTLADVQPHVDELCSLLTAWAAIESGTTEEEEVMADIDWARFHAYAVGVLAPGELTPLIGDTCPDVLWLFEFYEDWAGY